MKTRLYNKMKNNKEKKVFAFAGSFNPPHNGHLMMIKEMLEMEPERIHIFVRINESLDLVDAKTKEKWFEQFKKDYGWDKVVIHMVESKKITGKKYSLQVIRDSFKHLDEQAGEHITHYFAGDDYRKYKLFWRLLTKGTKLVIQKRDEISSTMIRNDLEGTKEFLPICVYEDLTR